MLQPKDFGENITFPWKPTHESKSHADTSNPFSCVCYHIMATDDTGSTNDDPTLMMNLSAPARTICFLHEGFINRYLFYAFSELQAHCSLTSARMAPFYNRTFHYRHLRL